jgi:hypothetical protein
VLGPGPGDPSDMTDPKMAFLRGLTAEVIRGHRHGVLGVCLGHELIAAELGLEIVRKEVPYQGAQTDIDLFGRTETVGFCGLGDRDADDVGAAQGDHLAEVAVVDGVDGVQAEAGGEPPGRTRSGCRRAGCGRGRPCGPPCRSSLLDLLGQPLADAAEPDVPEGVELPVLQDHLAVLRHARPRRRPRSARTTSEALGRRRRRPGRRRSAARG